MKRKGFTLIELLAVIVILAIIALIAVPVIMNIITSARKSSFEDTAYGLISAGEMYYAQELLENGMASDVEFTIEEGEFVGTNKLEVKGALPSSGSIKVTRDGKVALAISNGTYCVTKGYADSEIITKDEFESCDLPAGVPLPGTLAYLARTNEFVTAIHACATNGTTCPTGEKFAIEVAPGDIKNFYVVSEENNTVTLIMDSNIGSSAWINKEDYLNAGGTEEEWDSVCDDCGKPDKGPITVLNYLENQTAGWTNITSKNYTLTDSHNSTPIYQPITRTNAKARLITATEALSIVSYSWSYANLSGSMWGYWTSSGGDYIGALGFGVDSNGQVNAWDIYTTSSGIRPVIELSK